MLEVLVGIGWAGMRNDVMVEERVVYGSGKSAWRVVFLIGKKRERRLGRTVMWDG